MQKLPTYLRWSALALLVYMPLHLLLAQSLSLFTGGLAAWKITKDIVLFAAALLAGVYILGQREKHLPGPVLILLTLIISYAALHLLFVVLNPSLDLETALLATVYNTRLFWALILGYAASHGLKRSEQAAWQATCMRWLLATSVVVALLGVVQYFLPADFMEHLGYGLDRGAKPSFAIDDKPDLPRIFSTLRDPNSLGAFLLLPIAIAASRLLSAFKIEKGKRLTSILFLAALGTALLLTFSRSAWLGAVATIAYLGIQTTRSHKWIQIDKRYLVGIGIFVAAAVVSVVVWRDQYFVQNLVWHGDEATVELDPNEKRLRYFQQSIDASIEQPLGHGPGMAGIVSIRNPNGGFLPENYYLQIAYEVGILGLTLFVAIQVLIYRQLSRQFTTLSYVLRASFGGLLISSLLLHTWSNEAVMYSWWMLAGVALASSPTKPVPNPA
jgi:hypothetical protein